MTKSVSFKTSCPQCEAPEDEARLEVVIGRFVVCGVRLKKDGFNVLKDAEDFQAEEVKVYCNACDQTFPLEECKVKPELETVVVRSSALHYENAVSQTGGGHLEVRSPAYPSPVTYVRVVKNYVDGTLEELVYWAQEEWQEDEDTMGAILGAMKDAALGTWTDSRAENDPRRLNQSKEEGAE